MDRGFRKLLPGLLLLGCLCYFPSNGRSQDEPAATASEGPPAEGLPTDPNRSPLAGDPKTPDELFEATLLMVDIARVDLAKLYLNRLMEESLDDEVLLELRDKYGAAPFLKLTSVPELKT